MQHATYEDPPSPAVEEFSDRLDLLRWAATVAPPECPFCKSAPLTCEFGVYGGDTLAVLAATRPRVVGFDCWTGLPEAWRPGFPKGMFAIEKPDINYAELVDGLFAMSLPAYFSSSEGSCRHVAPAHVDCDLYTSTRDVLALGPLLLDGSFIVFDEYEGYPGAEHHEAKAWTEFTERSRHALWRCRVACVPGDQQARRSRFSFERKTVPPTSPPSHALTPMHADHASSRQ